MWVRIRSLVAFPRCRHALPFFHFSLLSANHEKRFDREKTQPAAKLIPILFFLFPFFSSDFCLKSSDKFTIARLLIFMMEWPSDHLRTWGVNTTSGQGRWWKSCEREIRKKNNKKMIRMKNLKFMVIFEDVSWIHPFSHGFEISLTVTQVNYKRGESRKQDFIIVICRDTAKDLLQHHVDVFYKLFLYIFCKSIKQPLIKGTNLVQQVSMSPSIIVVSPCFMIDDDMSKWLYVCVVSMTLKKNCINFLQFLSCVCINRFLNVTTICMKWRSWRKVTKMFDNNSKNSDLKIEVITCMKRCRMVKIISNSFQFRRRWLFAILKKKNECKTKVFYLIAYSLESKAK